MNNIKQLIKEIVNELKFPPPLGDTSDNLPEAMFPKGFKRHSSTCALAALHATKYFLDRGIKNFKIHDGYAILFPDKPRDYKFHNTVTKYRSRNSNDHTWIEFDDGRIFDPTKKQWKNLYGVDPKQVVYYSDRKYTPKEYIDKLKSCCLAPREKELLGLKENDPVAPEEQPGHGKTTSGRKMTYDDLLQATTPARKVKADHNVRVRSIPVSVDNEGHEQWNFRYTSDQATGDPGGAYQGRISFLKGEVGKDDDAIELLCEVDCKCKDYMYRFAYNNAAQGAGQVGRDSLSGVINRKPKPAYDFGVGLCKHLAALRKYLQTKITSVKRSNLFESIGDVAKSGPFTINYYD